MMTSKVEISKFHSFEQQASYFRSKTGVCLPRMTYGRSIFFSDLIGWANDYGKKTYAITLAHVLQNPAYGLSFPNATDVLSSVLCSLAKNHSESDINCLLKDFGLPEDKATQPITSLSGGELLLLTFAKASAMLPLVDGIVACSPTHWLNETRYKYWKQLENEYIAKGKYVNVLLLDGELFPGDITDTNDEYMSELTLVKWDIQVDELEILFDAVQFPIYHPASVMKYSACDKKKFTLSSPTLLTGDNGVGKSVLSKLLSGIIRTNKGEVSIHAPNGQGGARLLFQDSIAQLFGMSIEDHLDWVFQFDGDKRNVARSIYNEIDSVMRQYVKNHRLDESSALGERATCNTLLQAKISLIAERLASEPPLLILDEPGWGLSRSIARKFVWTVCQNASKYNVAILLISHQLDLWRGITKSHLHLTKEPNAKIRIEEKNI